MTVQDQINAEHDRLMAMDRRRLLARRRTERLPTCPTCGGRIKNGRCAGDGVIRCGLWKA